MTKRCQWVATSKNPLMQAYHDKEWGKPIHDDQKLFEMLSLEGYQAGLSWEIVLNKRQAFCQAFHDYALKAVAQMTPDDIDILMDNPGIVRHRAKLEATVNNAQVFQKIQAEFGSFDHYIWSWTDFKTLDNQIQDPSQIPTKSALSEAISKDLKKRGFKFVGPVCIYSFLEAAGLINDHEDSCDFKS